MPYHCRALSGSKWTTLPSALLLACDSVLQSCDHTNVHAELRSQSMVIMDYLVATAQDDIHATIKSTRYCVVHLTLCGRNDKRPDGATQIPWKRSRWLAWDATCPYTYAQSYVLVNSSAVRPNGKNPKVENLIWQPLSLKYRYLDLLVQKLLMKFRRLYLNTYDFAVQLSTGTSINALRQNGKTESGKSKKAVSKLVMTIYLGLHTP